MPPILPIAVVAAALSVAGCGQKGPLYLPSGAAEPPAAEERAPASLPPGAQSPADELPGRDASRRSQ
ncbi:MAG: lipoprotein [Lautropia sp.]